MDTELSKEVCVQTAEHLLSEKDYRGYKALSASDIRLLAKSFYHYQHRLEWPEDYHSTVALRQGTIIHACVLEPERFDSEFVVLPEINKRTKAGKAEWEEWEKENVDKFPLTEEEHRKAMVIRHHVMQNPKASELFTGGQAEVPILWHSKKYDREFKARADYIKVIGDTMLILDLKTTQEASFEAFQRSVIKWSYSVQAAHYRDGFSTLHPDKDVHFIWVAVEKSAPYGVSIFSANEEVYEHGKKLIEKGINNYDEGMKDPGGVWLPYPADIQQMRIPRWAQ